MNYPHDSFPVLDGSTKKKVTQVLQRRASVPGDGLRLREVCSISRVWQGDKEQETAWTGKDMSAFSIVLMLLLLGIFAAGHTERPVFWLLVGPVPLAVGFTLTTLFRQGFVREICSKRKRYTRVGKRDASLTYVGRPALPLRVAREAGAESGTLPLRK
jgi:hypothetical protein